MINHRMLCGTVFLFAAAVAFSCSADAAEDPVFSGPQPGEKLAALPLVGVYDDLAGKEFDPIADADGKPSLIVFVHKLTRPGWALARGLTAFAKSRDKNPPAVALAWLDDDKAAAEEYLLRARKSLNAKVPIGISIDGGEGPGAYGLNRNVELTILVADKNEVVANFALVQPSMSDGVKIAGELAKLIGEEPPTAKQLQEIAYPGMKNRAMQRQRQTRPNAPPSRERSEPSKEN